MRPYGERLWKNRALKAEARAGQAERERSEAAELLNEWLEGWAGERHEGPIVATQVFLDRVGRAPKISQKKT